MPIRMVAPLVALLCLLANASSALTVTVGGDDWEVTTLTGSYNDLTAELTSQVWWGDGQLAEDFATEVRDALGMPNSTFGPFFASEVVNINAGPEVYVGFWQSNNLFGESLVGLSSRYTYAIAEPVSEVAVTPTAVPIPLTAVLVAAVLVLVVAGFAVRRDTRF